MLGIFFCVDDGHVTQFESQNKPDHESFVSTKPNYM